MRVVGACLLWYLLVLLIAERAEGERGQEREHSDCLGILPRTT